MKPPKNLPKLKRQTNNEEEEIKKEEIKKEEIKKEEIKDIEDLNIIETYNDNNYIINGKDIKPKPKRIRNKNEKNIILDEMIKKNCDNEIIQKLKNIWLFP